MRDMDIASLRAENELLRAALTECAAEWSSPPTTIGGAFPYLSAEFQRRMQLAADALAARLAQHEDAER